eukprot:352281-Chlamydomonas_euryale.AAC.2
MRPAAASDDTRPAAEGTVHTLQHRTIPGQLLRGRRTRCTRRMQVLKRRGADRVIVFCNKIENCRSVENHLRRSVMKGLSHKVRPSERISSHGWAVTQTTLATA